MTYHDLELAEAPSGRWARDKSCMFLKLVRRPTVRLGEPLHLRFRRGVARPVYRYFRLEAQNSLRFAPTLSLRLYREFQFQHLRRPRAIRRGVQNPHPKRKNLLLQLQTLHPKWRALLFLRESHPAISGVLRTRAVRIALSMGSSKEQCPLWCHLLGWQTLQVGVNSKLSQVVFALRARLTLNPASWRRRGRSKKLHLA